MTFQKVEYEFPDEGDDDKRIEIEPSGAETVGKSKKDDDGGELEIEVVDDTPAADRNRKASKPPEEVTDEELEEYSDKVRNRIKHFSKGYHDERRAKETALREREELETYARKLVDENKNLKGTVGKNQSALVEQAKRAASTEHEQARRAYKEAYEAGDSEGVLTAQEALTDIKMKVDRLSSFKAPALQEEETPVKVPSGDTQPQPEDKRAKSWADENTWFGTDDEMTSFALGLHSKLTKQGVDPQSNEYYDAINARMRHLFPENFEDEGENEVSGDTPRKRSTNVVAPATRSTAPRKVRLTRTQVALAKRLGVPLDLYAKQVAEDMRKQKNG